MSTKVTILTPVLNNLHGLKKTVLSVLSQEFCNIEYLVIDGGSGAETIEFLLSINDPRFSFHSGKDGGLYSAINWGIRNTTGDYIAILNAGDTYYSPRTISNLLRHVVHGKKPTVYFGKVNYLQENGEFTTSPNSRINKYSFFRGCEVPHPTTLIARYHYEKLGLYSEEFRSMSDYDLLLRFYLNGVKFIDCNEIVVHFAPAGISSDFELCVKEAFIVRRRNGVPNTLNYFFHYRSLFFYSVNNLLRRILGEKTTDSLRKIRRRLKI